jgi:hypothetical protein
MHKTFLTSLAGSKVMMGKQARQLSANPSGSINSTVDQPAWLSEGFNQVDSQTYRCRVSDAREYKVYGSGLD